MTRARALAGGMAWTYGAQVVTVLLQFGYAAITSRHVGAAGFGAYAVALSVAGIVNLFANGGLGQTVARMELLDSRALHSLVLFALLLGGAASAFTLATADFWAWLWGTPDATAPIRWLAISSFTAPVVGLASGLLRRQGRFPLLAWCTLASNMLGMTAGAALVVTAPSAASLLASPVIAQAILAVALFVMSRDLLWGLAPFRHARAHVNFSAQVTVQNLAHYLNVNLGSWVAARYFGAAMLGQWNRADVLTTVPFQQVQSAMTQTLYPEFRHDISGPVRARVAWSDLLSMIAWVAFPLAALAALVTPAALPLLFGDGWAGAVSLSPFLAAIGGLQTVSVLLGAAVEALGRYSWVWIAIGARFMGVGGGAVLALVTGDFGFVVGGLAVGLILFHGSNIISCVRAGYLDSTVLARNYLGALATALAIWGAGQGVAWLVGHPGSFVCGVLVCVTLVTVASGLVWRWRSHVPPVKFARKYGLL